MSLRVIPLKQCYIKPVSHHNTDAKPGPACRGPPGILWFCFGQRTDGLHRSASASAKDKAATVRYCSPPPTQMPNPALHAVVRPASCGPASASAPMVFTEQSAHLTRIQRYLCAAVHWSLHECQTRPSMPWSARHSVVLLRPAHQCSHQTASPR